MPRFDQTGPDGKGPLTGRGLGDCNDNSTLKDNRRFYGRGWRNCFRNWSLFFRGRGKRR